MPEHQQMQKPGKPDSTFQKQAALASQTHVSHPASIIQRARINPKSLTAADVLQLQRTIGNRAVGRLLSEIRNHSKVQEASIQRQEIPEEEPLQGKFETIQRLEPEDEEKLQMKSVVQRQEISEEEDEPIQGKMIGTIQRQEIPEEEPLQKKSENNTGMPDNLKAGVESLSGIDMSDVRVHYNSDKPAKVGALAYTQGTNIHVAPGQERHLPHEAWHVVQQAQGRVLPTFQMKGVAVNDDEGLEREADEMREIYTSFIRNDATNKRTSFETIESKNLSSNLNNPSSLDQLRKIHISNYSSQMENGEIDKHGNKQAPGKTLMSLDKLVRNRLKNTEKKPDIDSKEKFNSALDKMKKVPPNNKRILVLLNNDSSKSRIINSANTTLDIRFKSDPQYKVSSKDWDTLKSILVSAINLCIKNKENFFEDEMKINIKIDKYIQQHYINAFSFHPILGESDKKREMLASFIRMVKADTIIRYEELKKPRKSVASEFLELRENYHIQEISISRDDKEEFAKALKNMPIFKRIKETHERRGTTHNAPTGETINSNWKTPCSLESKITIDQKELNAFFHHGKSTKINKHPLKNIFYGVFKNRVSEADNFIKRIVQPDILKEIEAPEIIVHLKYGEGIIHPKRKLFRAHAGDKIHLAQDDLISTIVHEIGHYLEKNINPVYPSYWHDLQLLLRGRHEHSVQRSRKDPKVTGHGQIGIRNEGRFRGEYPATGKYTSSAYEWGDTEITSMTLQFLSDPKRFNRMINKDPVQAAIVIRGISPIEYAGNEALRKFDRFLPNLPSPSCEDNDIVDLSKLPIV